MKSLVSIAIAMASLTAAAQTSSSTTTSTPSATTTAASPVTQIGTSTASAEQKPVEDKKWSATFVSQAEVTADQAERLGEQTVATVNYIGAGYKVTKDTKLGVRQYFAYGVGRDSNGQIETQWTALTVGTKVPGIFGSDDIAPLFWYYLPTDNALKNLYSKDQTPKHNGILRLDAEVAWTLNPKWTVSYYLNPRQSLVPGNQAYVDNTGAAKSLESTTTLYHFAYGYYNVNDAVQPYAYVGEHNRYGRETDTMPVNNAMVGVGANFTAMGGKLILNPEIYNEVAQGQQMFENSEVNYMMTVVVAL